MGNKVSCGIGVLNETDFRVMVGMSMIITHYYENYLESGEIFYRWPGTVWYTVFAKVSNDNRMSGISPYAYAANDADKPIDLIIEKR